MNACYLRPCIAALLTVLLPACSATGPDSVVEPSGSVERLEFPSLEARDLGLAAEIELKLDPLTATREQFIAHALASHPLLRAEFEAWRAAQQQGQVVKTLPSPQLRFTEFIEEVQTRTGPQQRRLGVSQRFPWPGELDLREQVADARSRAASFALAESALQIVRRVELAYDEYAYLARDREVWEDLQDLLVGFEPIVQARVRSGASQEDLLRLQIEIGRVEDEIAAIDAQRGVQFAELLEASGWPWNLGELPDFALPEARRIETDREQLLSLALSRSPSLARWEARYDAAVSDANLVGYARKPSFVFGVETILTGDAPISGVPGSGDDPWMISLSLDVPIWGTSYDAQEEQARHRITEARARWENSRLQLRTQVERFALRAEESARRAELYQESLLPRAEEVVQLTLASYRVGRAQALDWLDAQRTLLALRRAYWRAHLDNHQAQVELRAITAERLP